MDTAFVILLVLAFLVVLGLSVSNYLGARKGLAAAKDKAETAQEGFLELKAAVEELESWASDYFAADQSMSHSDPYSVCPAKPGVERRNTSALLASSVGWQALLPALTATEKSDNARDEHLVVLLRWAMASNNKESARWYVNELRGAPITDVACKWLLQDSDVWNYGSPGGLSSRTATYLKGALESRESENSSASRPELAF